MTFPAGRLEQARLTRTARAARFDQARALTIPGPFKRAAVVVGDLFGLVAIAFSIPFVVLAIGIPIMLCVRLLAWIGSLL